MKHIGDQMGRDLMGLESRNDFDLSGVGMLLVVVADQLRLVWFLAGHGEAPWGRGKL